MREQSIQHKATIPTIPFEDGAPVLIEDPEIYTETEDYIEREIRVGIASGVAELLRSLAAAGDVTDVGRTVKLLAFLAGMSDFKTKAELAANLKISPGRISQILQGIPNEFKSFANLQNRAKTD